MLEFKDLVALNKALLKADPNAPVAYSINGENLTYDAMKQTLVNELQELGGSWNAYRENKSIIFRMIEETLTDILPKKVLDAYGQFAEVKTLAQGEKPIFKRKIGKMRAKQFITRVGLAGVYEVFKLGTETVEIPTSAIGGAAQIGIEEFLDGRVDFAELTAIVMDGMDELIYREIAAALQAAVSQLPAANKVNTNVWNEAQFDNLLAKASAYGAPAIYCTFEFAATMMPAGQWSNAMIDERWNNGYFTRYKGHPVIVLPQSFEDETNEVKVIDPTYCWIIPMGTENKPVKVVFEGGTLVDERANADWSKEIQVYKKVGVGVMMTNNIFSYVNTSLT